MRRDFQTEGRPSAVRGQCGSGRTCVWRPFTIQLRALTRASAASDDAGFTLIELLVTMVIAGILMAIGDMALRSYTNAQSERATAAHVVSSLRDTAEQAQSEGRTYCVSFDSSTTWSVWRYSCDPSWVSGTMHATRVGTGLKTDGNSYLAVIAFSTPDVGLATGCPAGPNACVYFYPRGVASGGALDVERAASSKAYVVNVGGLTSRVYQS